MIWSFEFRKVHLQMIQNGEKVKIKLRATVVFRKLATNGWDLEKQKFKINTSYLKYVILAALDMRQVGYFH